ncbi:D-alanyl-D-alanine carboxypeptidase family protein [Paenibacillus sp. EC2-1]|uniref:D-alanyl-D-alanine carboxypeptidase family protein n=1 Tax=Paenibacillus sp. EC2-1 TaxID=3388665 RepID=UPI003BEF4A1D
MVFNSVLPVQAEPQNEPYGGPSNHAQAAALIDVTSGRLLYSKRGDERMRIASLTKIMTAIVAIERGNLKDSVKVTKNSFAKEGSSLFLKLGEEMSLENLLYGLMLRSGNDAASAIAEHVGGSEEGFVLMMNEKATALGLSNSHFMNPHGLDHDEHYSSANDLAKLTAYALKNPTFKEIVKTPVKKAPNPNEKWDYKWDNKNKMLRFYEGADGVKTGYTKKAFRCLVSSATRNGQQIAAVTLNDGNDWNDHSNMLDYGFDNFPLHQIAAKGQKLQGYSLVTGTGFSYALAKGEEDRVYKKLVLDKPRNPDLSFGLRGFVEISLDGKKIGQVPVFVEGSRLPEDALQDQPEKTTFSHQTDNETLWQSAGHILRHMFGGAK